MSRCSMTGSLATQASIERCEEEYECHHQKKSASAAGVLLRRKEWLNGLNSTTVLAVGVVVLAARASHGKTRG